MAQDIEKWKKRKVVEEATRENIESETGRAGVYNPVAYGFEIYMYVYS